MLLSATSSSSRLAASENATKQNALFERALAMRIQLQKLVDAGNTLPGRKMLASAKEQSDEAIEAYHKLNTSLDATLKQVSLLIEKQVPSVGNAAGLARGKATKSNDLSTASWDAVLAPQLQLRPHWEATLDKWNARLHFGSERKQSKLKVFNSKFWGQVEAALSDRQRALEKSRMPLDDSLRMDKSADLAPGNEDEDAAASDANSDGDESDTADVSVSDAWAGAGTVGRDKKRRRVATVYDTEVYDDRQFYNLLLKSFIQSASAAGGADGGQAAGMRPDDLEALRKYRRSKTSVDRRASKGRKIRYVVHAKLQNFMFPVEQPEAPLDVDRLYQSLFQ